MSWRELMTTALLGTDQAALPTLDGDTALAKLLQQVDGDSAEKTLLTQAGIVSLHEAVGQQPTQTDGRPDLIPPPDPAHTLNNATTQYLSVMFEGRFKELLPQLIALANDVPVNAPPTFMPNLLDYGLITTVERPQLLTFVGAAGEKLAASNPRWAYASASAATWNGARALWQETKPAHRQALMRQLRQQNPQLARELINHVWSGEPNNLRRGLLSTCSINLTSDDEALLEKALDDRNVMVRREAVKQLAVLQSSRYVQRVTSYAQDMLRWDDDQKTLEVRFPITVTSKMARDGITAEPGKQKRATWRGQQIQAIIGAVPLTFWEKRLEATPAKILAGTIKSSWPRSLNTALLLATQRQENATWALAMLNREISSKTAPLFNLLSTTQQEQLIEKLVSKESGQLTKESALLKVLNRIVGLWPPSIADMFIDRLVMHYQSAEPGTVHTQLATTQMKFARACPPDMADDVSNRLQPFMVESAWRGRLHNICAILRFRHGMYQAIEKGKHE